MLKPTLPDLAVIDGQRINIATLDDAVAAAIGRASAGEGFRLFTLNLDHIVKRREDPAFAAAYAKADFISADGAPVAALARRQTPTIQRATGADLVVPLCRAAAKAGVPVALFGSDMPTLETCATNLLRTAPGLEIVHLDAPPYGFDPGSEAAFEAAKRIEESGARIVFVALGAPKQELFAATMAGHVPSLGFICIGAALDFIAGTQARAPLVFQKTGLEWFWRLVSDPKRFYRRYVLCAGVLVSLLAGGGRGAVPARTIGSPSGKGAR